MRVAIAHDYLTQRGGAERVVLALTRAFPDAPVFTTMYDPATTYPDFRSVDVRTSWLNRIGPLRRRHRAALPLLPLASSSMQIDADVVIASSSGWAHGFHTTGRKLVYCYSPARWLYEPDRYLGDDARMSTRLLLRTLSPALRRWDRRAAVTADRYLAISTVTQDRIQRIYGFTAPVVPAPHTANVADEVEALPGANAPGYYLTVSRLLPYKNVLPIVQAFAKRPDLRLVIVGSGPEKRHLMAEAPSNVAFLESLTDAQMDSAYFGCRALVAASFEDFGLTPLEAAAHGKPSVVLRWGGFLDTVVPDVTGVFFADPSADAIADALDRAGTLEWDVEAIRARAQSFGEDVFIERIRQEVSRLGAGSSPLST